MYIFRGSYHNDTKLNFSGESIVTVALTTATFAVHPLLTRNEFQIYSPDMAGLTFQDRLTSGLLLVVGIPGSQGETYPSKSGCVDKRMMRAIINIVSIWEKDNGTGKSLSSGKNMVLSCLKEASYRKKKSNILFESGLKFKYCIDAAAHDNETPVSPCDLKRKTRLGLGQMRQLSRDLYGLPLNQLIFTLGMQKAFAMITSGTENAEMVARHCGYSTRQNFITSFRRRFETTPDKVRLNGKLESRG